MVEVLWISLYLVISVCVYIGLYLHSEKLPIPYGDTLELFLISIIWPCVLIVAATVFLVQILAWPVKLLNKKLDRYKEHKRRMKEDKKYALRYKMKKVFK